MAIGTLSRLSLPPALSRPCRHFHYACDDAIVKYLTPPQDDSMPTNLYGDQLTSHTAGHGADIASQRADDLDLAALDRIRQLALNQPVTALDLACGLGGQALRMVEAGACVAALDIADFTLQLASLPAHARPDDSTFHFIQADLRHLPDHLPFAPYDVVVCQRAIHYLPYAEALSALRDLAQHLRPSAHLFLSASGLGSELGQGYPHVALPVAQRFCPIAPAMADRHKIHAPVCLYTPDDLEQLLSQAGFHTYMLWSSPFGNVKACAHLVC